jgi:Zn-dependent M28 family amino/carboxypeptidase
VLCHFDGESDQLVVIGAHYDVAGEQDGADDNASGVATIIELAKLIKEKGVTPKHNLQIVAYTLEEPPFFRTEHMGSYVHAEKLKLQNVDIRYMVSVEMVGYYSDAKGSQEYPIPLLGLFYPTTGHF